MFSQRWALNGLLVLAILLIVWLGGFFESPRQPSPTRAVPGFDPDAVERIEIRGAAFSLALVRREGNWRFVEPLEWPASRAAVERLLDIPLVGDVTPLDSESIDPRALGFDASGAALLLGATRVRFGIANNIGGRRYTMIGEAVYLLPDLHAPLVEQGLPGFVDRRLLPPDFELVRLELPGATIQHGEPGWESPDLPATQAAELANGWQELQATRVAVSSPADNDSQRIVARLDGAADVEFLLLSTRPEVVIANPALGLRYHFPASLRDRLLPPGAAEDPA